MEAITRFYQQCDPAMPLPAGDPRYVPFEGVRGAGDLVKRVANAIRRADQPIHMLFAGHPGCGKSTELFRLQKMLDSPPRGKSKFFVVFFEANEEDIDVNDVDFPDLPLSMVRHVGKTLRELNDELGIAGTLNRLGMIEQDRGNLSQAEARIERRSPCLLKLETPPASPLVSTSWAQFLKIKATSRRLHACSIKAYKRGLRLATSAENS